MRPFGCDDAISRFAPPREKIFRFGFQSFVSIVKMPRCEEFVSQDTCKLSRDVESLLLPNKFIHRDDHCLHRENLLRQHPVNFRIGVETGVLEDNAAVVEVGRPS